MEVNYWMAKMTLEYLEKLEKSGFNFMGLTQDWQELIAKEELKNDAEQKGDEQNE